jgi:hypothetical protein
MQIFVSKNSSQINLGGVFKRIIYVNKSSMLSLAGIHGILSTVNIAAILGFSHASPAIYLTHSLSAFTHFSPAYIPASLRNCVTHFGISDDESLRAVR